MKLTKEITARFDSEASQHFKRWLKAHPAPPVPDAAVIIAQAKTERAKFHESVLRAALAAAKKERYYQDDERNEWECHVDLFELLEVPALVAWRKALREHSDAIIEIQRLIHEVKQNYLDQVLFDHVNAFVHLSTFKKWVPGKPSREDAIERGEAP